MLTDEERVLREGLHALGAGAPAEPAGRVEASVRRARFIRARQVSVAVVAAVAVVTPAFVVASIGPSRRTNLTSPARWAGHVDPALRTFADKAFAEWDETNDLRGEDVRWLYTGAVPGTNDVAVAFATCREELCSRITLLTADKREAIADEVPDTSPWVGDTRTIKPDATVPLLATYSAPIDFGDRGPENVLFVVPAPGTAKVTYTSEPIQPGTGGHGELTRQPDGSFSGTPGYVSSPTTVAAYDEKGNLLQFGELDLGNTRWVDPVGPLPSGYSSAFAGGHVQLKEEHFTTTYGDLGITSYVVFLRCRSRFPMNVVTGTVSTSVPCDGRVHKVGQPQPVRGDIAVEYGNADRFTTYADAIAAPR